MKENYFSKNMNNLTKIPCHKLSPVTVRSETLYRWLNTGVHGIVADAFFVLNSHPNGLGHSLTGSYSPMVIACVRNPEMKSKSIIGINMYKPPPIACCARIIKRWYRPLLSDGSIINRRGKGLKILSRK